MSALPFTHLHLHTQYSLLDGANKIPDVIERAKARGQTAIGMTDHGNMHGAIEFYTEAKALEMKAIIGCELYVTNASRFEKAKHGGERTTFHLTVLAKDLTGYHNLCRLVSLAYKEGFSFKPRVDHELLAKYSEGLLVLSGCLASELGQAAIADNEQRAREAVEFLSGTFKNDFFLEIQPHAIPEQRKLNAMCVHFSKTMGIPLVATTDCHYTDKDDHFAQEVLMCISTAKTVHDPDRLKHEGVSLYLKDGNEMLLEFGNEAYAEEAVRNTQIIKDRCNLKFDFSKYFMPQPKMADERPLIEIMAEKAREGLLSRFSAYRKRAAEGAFSWDSAQEALYQDRLEMEIRLIDKMGFAGYFLVVSDFIVWAKEHSIPVGPGRGSGAGSLVAFCLRITEVDPIIHKLLFERFLNPERVSLPDIDVDFCINGRDQVIKYVVEKYGKDNVAQIATFGTLKAKAAIKDVGRALGLSFAETDRIAQLVPAPRQGFDYPLSEALKMEPKLAEYAQGEGKQLIELACKLEGLTRHSSTHAAGVVIGDRPLTELLPMMVDKDGHDVTQYSMKYVEKVGLVKFDFLGLKTLTVLHTATKLILQSQGKEIDLNALPLDDRQTYQMLGRGDTTGVFQLESGGITEMTVRLKPSNFDDLVAILALYRPGPLDSGMVEHYIQRKHGREPVQYLHPMMRDTLCDTYGIMIYQEQIMQLARVLAGYSLGEADLLRRAMGKKNAEEMAKQRTRFVTGAATNEISDKLASEIFDQMETFARYGFNRSHSAAYALISFQTAYLKAHYPVEFMAALMSHEMEDSDKTLKNLNECREQHIEVLPPDVNRSLADFSVDQGRIRYGLVAVKGIGLKAVEAILHEREKKSVFKDLEDFAARVDYRTLNKRVFENLIKCGAFDFSNVSRREMMESLDDIIRAAQSVQLEAATNQISLFGGSAGEREITRKRRNAPEWPINRKLSYEREALGFYISGHPLRKFQNDLKRLGTLTVDQLLEKGKSTGPPRDRRDKAPEFRVAGMVTALQLKNTKKGDRYATFTLEDAVGTIEAIIWPDTYREVSQLLVAEEPVVITGRADISDERRNFIVSGMESLIRLRDSKAHQGVIILQSSSELEARLSSLQRMLQHHKGNCPVTVKLQIDDAEICLPLRDHSKSPVLVSPSETLCEEVEQLFGRPVLTFV